MSRDDSNGNCSRELSEWGRNSLAWWFQLDTWKAREAICLICGIDPRKTKIEWHAATSENLDHQGTLFGPVSWNSFLYEDWHSCQTAAKQKASKDDKGMPSDEVVAVAEYISDIEFSLRTVWIRFSRAVDIETDNKATVNGSIYVIAVLKTLFTFFQFRYNFIKCLHICVKKW